MKAWGDRPPSKAVAWSMAMPEPASVAGGVDAGAVDRADLEVARGEVGLAELIPILCLPRAAHRAEPAQVAAIPARPMRYDGGMIISSPCVVSLTWRLEDAQGQLIDELTQPMAFLMGGDDLLSKVEEALLGQTTGFEAHLHLEPEHAFGDYHAELVFFETRDIFPKEVAPGMQFEGPPEGSTTPDLPKETVYTVTEVYDTHVVLDGNHPMAGVAIRIALTVCDVREATAEEIEQGSVAESTFFLAPQVPPDETIH
jgi:FKBP-type peptidyl-prolyl cis-trans isomerase SlyD